MAKFDDIVQILDKKDLSKLIKIFDILEDDLIFDAIKAWFKTPHYLQRKKEYLINKLNSKDSR